MQSEGRNDPTKKLNLEVETKAELTSISQLLKVFTGLQSTLMTVNKQLTDMVTTTNKAGEAESGLKKFNEGLATTLGYYREIAMAARQVQEINNHRSVGTNRMASMEQIASEYAMTQKLNKSLDMEWRLKVRNGEISAQQIRRMRDERQLKVVISELDSKIRSGVGVDRYTSMRLDAAMETLQKRKAAEAKAREDKARELREQREMASLRKQAEAEDRRRTAERLAAPQKEIDSLRKQAEAEDRRRTAEHNYQMGERKANRLMAPGELDLEKQLSVRSRRAKLGANRLALQSGLSLTDVAGMTDIPTLQVHGRLAKVRQTLSNLTQDQLIEAQRLQNAIQARIQELKLAMRPKTGPAALTDQQIFQRQVQSGGFKLSQLTGGDLGRILPGLSSAHQISPYESAQKARAQAARGRGDDATLQDSLKALDAIVARKKQIAELEKQAAANAREAAKSQTQKTNEALREHQQGLKANQASTEAALAEKAAADRRAKARENERIAQIANNKITMDGIKHLNHAHEIQDQLAASRLRASRAANEEDRLHEKTLQGLLGLRNRELARRDRLVAELPGERDARMQESRKSSRDRLFGDGGANILTIQAGLMANYQILGGIQSLFSGAMSSALEFDKALKQLQAISAATRNEMVLMKAALIEVAQGSKFGAAEVAQASVLLAQAGLSISDIQKTMSSVIALATASGSDLAKSVDVMTSVLSVFDMEASKSTEVANKLTAALNLSKLDIDKLALGMQYAGNAAADAGVTFNELVSGLSAMANAGIRSGSTLGTGLRQLFIDIQKPSDNFKAILERLGITLDDVDIRSQGFEGTLRNLQEKGFTTADAFQAFQIRSASAFAALSNNIDVFHNMQEAIDGTNAAIEANLVQMESLSVQYDHLKSNLGILAAEGLKPLLTLIRDVTQGFAHMLEGVDKSSSTLKVAVTGLATAFGTLAVVWGVNLTLGVIKLTGGLRSLLTITALTTASTKLMGFSMGHAATGAIQLATRATVLGQSLGALRLILGGLGVAFAGLASAAAWVLPLAAAGWTMWQAYKASNVEAEKLTDNLDEAKTKANALREQLDKQVSVMDSLGKAVTTLNTRYGRYSQHNSELQTYVRELSNQFKDQGLVLDDLANRSIDSVIRKLEELRRQVAQEYIATVRISAQADAEVLRQEQAKLESVAGEKMADVNARMNRLPASAPRRAEVQRVQQAANRYVNQGIYVRGDLGFSGIGDVNKTIADLTSDLTTKRPRGSQEVISLLISIREALDTRDVARGKGAKAYGVSKRADTAVLTELGIDAARNQAGSGFSVTNALRRQLSLKQTSGTADLNFLDKNLEVLRGKRSELEGLAKQEQGGVDFDKLSAVTQARINAYREQITAISQLESDYEAVRKPLWEIELNSRKEVARVELQAASDKVKRLEAQISAEKNSAVIEEDLGPQLQVAIHEEAYAREQLDKVTQEKTKLTEETIRRVEEARVKQLADRLEAARLASKQAADSADDTWRDLMASENQDPLAKTVKEFGDAFTKFQTQVKDKLGEGKSAFDEGEADIKRRIQLAGLGAKGVRTTAPGTFGGDYDNSQLNIRARVGSRFRMEALRRELIEYQKRMRPLQLQQVDKLIPEAEKKAAEGQALLDKIRKERDAAEAKHQANVAELQHKKEEGLSITGADTDQLNDSRNTLNFYDQQLSKQQQQTEEALRAAEALRQKRFEIRELILGQESSFDAMFEALKTGMEGLTQSISEGLQRIVTSAGDTSEAFREMADNILSSMLKIMNDKLAKQFMEMMVNFVMNFFTPDAGIENSGTKGVKDTIGRRNGGLIRMAGGGAVIGSTRGRDSVPAILQPGEFVLQQSAVEAVGPNFLTGLNKLTSSTLRQGADRTAKRDEAEKTAGQVNVWVVSPDQQPGGLSKDDVIVTVSDNIARNGPIRRLIKQVQMGG